VIYILSQMFSAKAGDEIVIGFFDQGAKLQSGKVKNTHRDLNGDNPATLQPDS